MKKPSIVHQLSTLVIVLGIVLIESACVSNTPLVTQTPVSVDLISTATPNISDDLNSDSLKHSTIIVDDQISPKETMPSNIHTGTIFYIDRGGEADSGIWQIKLSDRNPKLFHQQELIGYGTFAVSPNEQWLTYKYGKKDDDASLWRKATKKVKLQKGWI